MSDEKQRPLLSWVGTIVRQPHPDDEDTLRCLAAVARAHREQARLIEEELRRKREGYSR